LRWDVLLDSVAAAIDIGESIGAPLRGLARTALPENEMYWTQIDERAIGDVVILDLRGRMTVSDESKPAADTVRRLLVEGRTNILLNLAHLPFIDSLGIGDIVRGFTATQRAGGTLKLCGVDGRIRAVFAAIHLSEVIDSFESEQEALDSFRGSEDRDPRG
jgi:anti-sigma B factor antagonist